ncbi:serine/threonine-protein kinase [Asanoa sp. WMMD1127]|uniref:serine/threonine-protein kinase n=1 Tax=Asanoa sp. WMMD1127 TaxID=3016107 RepID=UPI00241609C6|nr:serine/threonine-protein kinase [Asanoa sp. WMMD1127]MDG4822713.1 serine/threonine-protein kinase [Asanoa sp. WMMD1127]
MTSEPPKTPKPKPTPEPEPVPAPGKPCARVVGGCYELVEQIGGGASGTVWRARSQATGEAVAVKLLRDELVPQPKAVMRFVQERAILAALEHENIVPVRELLTIGDSLGLVMELVEGGSARALLRERGTLTPAEAATVMAGVADGLAHAHHLGVVHRDLKPDNILVGTPEALDSDPGVRLTDFGIARVVDAPPLTTTGALLGTPNYLAPEVINGAKPSPSSDVYAFGMVLYELLTGRPPYAGHTPRSVFRRHVETRPRRNPGIPDVLWRIVSSCVDRNPACRPSAAGLGEALRLAAVRLGAAPALPKPPRLPMQSALTGRPWIPTQRRRVPAWHAITTVVSVFVLLTVALVALDWPGGGDGQRADASRPTASPGPSRSGGGGAKPQRAGRPASTEIAELTANRMAKPAPAKAARPSEAKVAPVPTAYGPVKCTGYQWKFLQPAFSNTCFATGPGIRVSGGLKSKEVLADITLTLKDTAGNRVGQPYTCPGLRFGPEMSERVCGAFELTPPRGRRYVLVQSWRVYDGDGTAIHGEAKSAEFAY